MKLFCLILSAAAFIGCLLLAVLLFNSPASRSFVCDHFTHEYTVTEIDARPYVVEFTRSYWRPFTFQRRESFHASHPSHR